MEPLNGRGGRLKVADGAVITDNAAPPPVCRETNVTELAEAAGLPQAAMSSQLALLREAGLVSCEANHRERQYYIADPRVNDTVRLLYSFFCAPKS